MEKLGQAEGSKDGGGRVPVQSLMETLGNLDRASGPCMYGWAALKVGEEFRTASIELLVDGTVAATTEADSGRPDLREAHIGMGRHAFELHLPRAYWDGAEHACTLRVRESGVLLPNSSLAIKVSRPSLSRMELEGTVFVCRGKLGGGAFPDSVALYEGRKPFAQTYDVRRHDDEFEVRIPLPADLCDGAVHSFVARVDFDGLELGEVAAITPYFGTPIDVLLDRDGGPLNASILSTGQRRYEALCEQLQDISATHAVHDVQAHAGHGTDEARGLRDLRNVMNAHDALAGGFTKRRPGDTFAALRFPRVEAPKVSVVVPVHNKFEVTYHCLASLVLAANRASFEVIVVDDASTDATVTMAGTVSGVTILRNNTSLGFVGSCNRGAAAARGEYVVLLNNDTEVAPHWLDEMLWAFEHFEAVGLVGAKLLFPDGRLQESGCIVWNNGEPWNYGRGANPRDPEYSYARQVDYASGACLMVPKPLWDSLSGFDEHYAPAYYEDTDLAFRVRERGFKTLVAPLAEVIHFEGVSNGTDVASGVKRYQEVNRHKFAARWAGKFRHHGMVGRDAQVAKDRNVIMRALVIDYSTPRPDVDAGGYAAMQEMRLLQALGFKITFVADNFAYSGRYTEELQRRGIECVYSPFRYSVQELLEARGAEFDIVYVIRYRVASNYIEAIRKYAARAKIVFNNCDLHFLRELRQAIAQKKPEQLDQAMQTRDEELALMRRVDVVLSYTETEHAVILSHNLDSTNVALCPWVVELPDQRVGYEARQDIAFLGGFAHTPNADAVLFFVKEVMPVLRRSLPGVSFLVYGSDVPSEIEALADTDVVIKGWVKDTSEVFNSCRVFLAPLKSGAGIKGKVIGALAHGVPSVISPIAMEGLGAADGVHVLVADTVEQWVQSITSLYRDASRWEAMSEAARDLARRRYSFERGKELMRSALAQAQVFPVGDQALCYRP